ncbi:MAG TPA: energy transducer TonB [Kofleriaceae bacterium]|nr:energy transducer TonB [Kofleriaceae bacterium]
MDTKHLLNATQTPAIDRGRGELYWLTGLVVISLAVHGVAIVAMRSEHAHPQATPRARTVVTMTVAPAKPAPKPIAAAEPEAARAAPRISPQRTARPVKAVVASAPQPTAETPADFTGVTMTNEAGAWTTPVGNGAAMNGPIGTAGARVTGRSRAGSSGGAETAAPQGPRTVAVGDLSQPPRAPVLSDKLERNYPEDARSRGLSGKAVMRVRVMPDGHVQDLVVVAESAGGFGEACKRTLRDSVWSPPLDLGARPVSTVVSYTCTFEVR